MMRTLWLLTKKNLKLLVRSKSSGLIVIFAPLLLILILGLSYNTADKYGINIGVHAIAFNDDVNSFITTLQEEEFKITKYDTSLESCINDLKLGMVHTCISLPESFKVEGNIQKEITFYVDPSKINLVWMVQQTLEKKLNLKSGEISKELTQDILNKLTDTKTKVDGEITEVTGINDKNKAASAGAGTASAGLKSLDVVPPANTYDTSIIAAIKTNLTDSLNVGLNAIGDAKSAIPNNEDGSPSAAEEKLVSATKVLKGALEMLSNNTGNVSYPALEAMITSLQADFTAAKTKLDAANTQIQSTTANLDSIKASLDQAVASLDNVNSVLTQIQTNLASQKVTEAGVISSPISVKIEQVAANKTYLNYLFPTLIILVIMFASLLLGTTLVMMEKNSPAFLRNFFLPIRKVTFVISTYLTNLILIIVQLIIILGLSMIFIPDLYMQLPAMILVLFLAASTFTFLGMALGYLFVSEETAILASISLGSLLLFLSGAIFPLEGMATVVRKVVAFNPFVIAEKMVKEIFLFSTPLNLLWMDLLILLSFVIVLFLVILIGESLLHNYMIHRFLHHHHKMHREKDKQIPKGI